MNTIAVVTVEHPEVFMWLGHMPVLHWCLEQLREVRGLTKIICMATRSLLPQLQKLVREHDVVTAELPAMPLTTDWIRNQYGIGDKCTVLQIVPINPFLPGSKIEECVHAVSHGKAPRAQLAQLATVTIGDGARGSVVRVLPAMLPTVQVDGPQAARLSRRDMKIVEVGLLESLNVLDKDNLLLAKAVVAAGAN